jgi:outer membrane protein TolC
MLGKKNRQRLSQWAELSAFFCLIMLPFSLQAQSELSLQGAIERTLQNNYNIQLVKKDLQIADNNVSYGNAGFLPSLDLTGSYKVTGEDSETKTDEGNYPGENNKKTGISGSVSLDWTLFDGFAMFARYDRLEETRRYSEIALQLEIESRLQELFNTYFHVVMLEKNIELLENTLEFSRERLEFLKSSNKLGAITSTEVLRAEVDYNNDQSTLKRQRVTLKTAMNQLRYVMGERGNTQFTVNDEISIRDLGDYEELKKQAFERNSLVRQAMVARDISEADEKLIEAAYYPNIRFSTDYTSSKSVSDKGFMLETKNNGYSASISASWNLFDGFVTSSARESAEIEVEKQEIYIQSIRAMIEMNLRTNYEAYADLKEVLRLEEQNLETASKNFDRSKEMFKYGTINALDLRLSQENLLLAEQRIVSLKYEIKTYETAILMLCGELGR